LFAGTVSAVWQRDKDKRKTLTVRLNLFVSEVLLKSGRLTSLTASGKDAVINFTELQAAYSSIFNECKLKQRHEKIFSSIYRSRFIRYPFFFGDGAIRAAERSK